MNSEPLLQIVESAAHRQRRRREHHRIELVEEPLAQNLAHVDRRRRQKHALAAPLVPVDVAFLFALQQKRQLAPRFPTRAAPASSLLPASAKAPRVPPPLASPRSPARSYAFQVPLEKRAALGRVKRKAPFALRKSFKEAVPSFAHPRSDAAASCGAAICSTRNSILRIARQLLEPVARNLPPEIIARHILDFVRLVEDHRRIFRQVSTRNRPGESPGRRKKSGDSR